MADLTYVVKPDRDDDEDGDIVTQSLNHPGGALAWSLLDALSTPKPERNTGLGTVLRPRFDRIAQATGKAGLLGRVYLARALHYFDAVDPEWTEKTLLPLFSWGHAEALPLWRSYSQGRIGSARLFNALKPALLQAFERQDLTDHEYECLTAMLLSVGIWHRQGVAKELILTGAEIKQALIVGPPGVRRNASWNLWRNAGAADGMPKDKAERWRTVLGPLFLEIWPLDAELRSERTSSNLVLMALECEGAFPDAVDAIVDVLVPYHLYSVSQSLRLEQEHDRLVRQFPLAFLRLANAVIDPERHPVPQDLDALLQECVNANPAVVSEPSYIRLFGLRRQRGA